MTGRRTAARGLVVGVTLAVGLLVGGCTPVGSGEASDGGPTTCSMSEAPGDVTARIDEAAFVPSSITVEGDRSIEFRNSSSLEHTVALDDGACASGVIAPGKSVTYIIGPVGRHGFHCTIHPLMTGTIEVTAS